MASGISEISGVPLNVLLHLASPAVLSSPKSAEEISDQIQCSKRAVYNALMRLYALGVVNQQIRKSTKPNGRRSSVYSITELGKNVVNIDRDIRRAEITMAQERLDNAFA